MMQADYELTVAAEHLGSPEPPDAPTEECLAEGEGLSDGEAGSTCLDGGLHGYEALGSDDGGGSDGAMHCDEAEEAGAEGPIHQAGQTTCPPSVALGAASDSDPADDAAVPRRDVVSADVWPVATSQDAELWGFGGFQAAPQLEAFADFGMSNPVLPEPPHGVPHLQATLLTEDEVNLIKETMKQVSLTPPPWAQNLLDKDFNRMVKDLVRSSEDRLF